MPTLAQAFEDYLKANPRRKHRTVDEVVSLRWERIDLERAILRVEETKTGEPRELSSSL